MPESAPPALPRPIGVLTASTITGTFVTLNSLGSKSSDLAFLVAPISCPQRFLVRLAKARHWNRLGKLDRLGRADRPFLLTHPADQFALLDMGASTAHHDRAHGLTPLGVGNADHRGIEDGRVLRQHIL